MVWQRSHKLEVESKSLEIDPSCQAPGRVYTLSHYVLLPGESLASKVYSVRASAMIKGTANGPLNCPALKARDEVTSWAPFIR